MVSQVIEKRDMGIYIHIPFCHHKCIYCDFIGYPNLDAYHEAYVDSLIQELALRRTSHPVSTIYFGGGTPTLLPVRSLARILDALYQHFVLAEDVEISIESNPGDYGKDDLFALRQLGFKRISFGVQTFDNQGLAFLGRSHRAEDTYANICMASAIGFEGLNVDLIYALPGQTCKDVHHNIEIAASLPINHISMYGLQLEEGTRLSYLVDKGHVILPGEEDVDLMYDAMVEGLAQKGFERYEISNFAKEGHYSRHNLRYWLYDDYLGFGIGASSFYNHQRTSNTNNIAQYIEALQGRQLPPHSIECIDSKRSQEDFCFLGLRTMYGINRKKFISLFGSRVEDEFGEVLPKLIEDGLLEVSPEAYTLTAKGAKYGNHVFEEFIR